MFYLEYQQNSVCASSTAEMRNCSLLTGKLCTTLCVRVTLRHSISIGIAFVLMCKHERRPGDCCSETTSCACLVALCTWRTKQRTTGCAAKDNRLPSIRIKVGRLLRGADRQVCHLLHQVCILAPRRHFLEQLLIAVLQVPQIHLGVSC